MSLALKLARSLVDHDDAVRLCEELKSMRGFAASSPGRMLGTSAIFVHTRDKRNISYRAREDADRVE